MEQETTKAQQVELKTTKAEQTDLKTTKVEQAELKTTKVEQAAGDHGGTTPATSGGVVADATTLEGPGKVCAAQTHKMVVAITGSAADGGRTSETTELGPTGFGSTVIESDETTGLGSTETIRLGSTETTGLGNAGTNGLGSTGLGCSETTGL